VSGFSEDEPRPGARPHESSLRDLAVALIAQVPPARCPIFLDRKLYRLLLDQFSPNSVAAHTPPSFSIMGTYFQPNPHRCEKCGQTVKP
jgi:hypothetical protein